MFTDRPVPLFVSIAETVGALGGEHTVSRLGRAVIELRNEETRCTASKAASFFGGASTISPLGQAIVAVCNEESRRSNLTADWLKTHGVRVREMLVGFLTAKLTTSRRMDLVEDHVQTFLCRLVERDTLRDHLLGGKEPSPSVLRIWLVQSAATEMRGWGVDASLRVSRGAKTNRDRLADSGKKPEAPVIHVDTVREVHGNSEEGGVSEYYDPRMSNPEEALINRQMIESHRHRIREKLNSRHAEVFDLLMDGSKRREVARIHGLTTGQVTAMLARIREVVAD